MKTTNYNESTVTLIFLAIPTIFVIAGLLFFPYPEISPDLPKWMLIPLFGSLFLLGVGFLYKNERIASKYRMAGWVIFSFYWATKINSLYYGEDGDFVNAFFCIAGIYVFFYVVYHEWLSIKRNERVSCLNWISGAASIAGFIYFGIENTPFSPWLIESVAMQSGWLLNAFTGNVDVYGVNIFYNGAFAVSIIFACTAIQSMVLFVGMIIPLKKVDLNRKIYGLLVTLVPIYFLNLIRNAFIAYLMGTKTTSFYIAHNIIGKSGSLIALIILLFIVIKIVPELFDEISCLIDLYKRNGPLEKTIKRMFLGKKSK